MKLEDCKQPADILGMAQERINRMQANELGMSVKEKNGILKLLAGLEIRLRTAGK